jgi:hypothetical protein
MVTRNPHACLSHPCQTYQIARGVRTPVRTWNQAAVACEDSPVPTALDNGRRSPRKLLRAVVARLLGRKPWNKGGTRAPEMDASEFPLLGRKP